MSDDRTVVDFGDGYSLTFDGSRNWMIVKSVTREAKKAGERAIGDTYESSEVVGYYGDPGAAAWSMVERKLRAKGNVTPAQLLKAIQDTRDEILSAVEAANLEAA